MITVQDFKKLLALQNEGCVVYCDDEEVSLSYHWDDDYLELKTDEPEKYACNFTFENDRYGTVFTLLDEDYANSNWTVKRFTEVNWKEM